MLDWLSQPWPWYVAGPLIGLTVPLLLLFTGKSFGISSSLRHLCAATLPGRADYFRYDWKRRGGWNLAFAFFVFALFLEKAILQRYERKFFRWREEVAL